MNTTTPTIGHLAGELLDAFARRDYAALAACLDDDVVFRGLIPPGPFTVTGPADTADRFQKWFGGPSNFEIVDASIGQLGNRLYFRWRVRVSDEGTQARVAEQHLYATADDRIQSLDLLCSGFQTEGVAA